MDYDITAESLDGTPATCTREFRSKLFPTISLPVHHSYKAIFCTWKSLLSRIQDISRDREHGTPLYFIDTCFADVQFHENMIRIQAWHPLFWNWNVSIRMRSEICAPGICMIRNVFEGFHSFAPLLSIFPPYRRESLKTLKRIVEKCSVSGWKRIFLRGLIEWNLESNMIIGNVDTGKASLELDEIVVLKIGGGMLFKFLSFDFIKISFYF